MASEGMIHVIDDDEGARESLAFLLSSAELTVRTYDSAVRFLQDFAGDTTGCIVTDIRMPEMTGLELLVTLKNRGIVLPVIVMTGHGDVPLAVTAMKGGAIDFLEKPFSDDAILAAVGAALNTNHHDARKEAERSSILERLATLSQRERQVLEGLVAGHANKRMAYDLDISPRTIEIYRAHVMSKMRASSLSDLVRMALAAGINIAQDDGPTA
ncbi:response regulator FixJ [Kaistia dalseonensis]|uniref:Two-component system response regulator FixJ n=1 Tax=Kaistia dalseonensis TaxID=410840 RepID=A0ABU0H807_9HYPH|nr:response regulator FixJ [Kaistia dalseonensis]MCX5495319.1 response regulator FixJ [Kaistia dalseonensis]MDQ0437905.1 two-component system response regulator FixJ [Kaistia dalseonensis]